MKALVAAAGGAGLCKVLRAPLLQGTTQELDEHAHLPTVLKTGTDTPTATPTSTPTSPPTDSRVVHVHSANATTWDFGDDYYGDFVDQDVVNAVVDQGVLELTGASSLAQAWQTLVPNYAPGKAIAIKVNFNNCYWCDTLGPGIVIDALVHPINPVIGGLLQAYPDFQTSDIWVYDATIGGTPPGSRRQIPQRFKDDCLYSGVRFFSPPYQWGTCNEIAGYDSGDSSANITWHNPPQIPTPPSIKVTDVLVNAAYAINMPIMKAHASGFGVTLSFKNHFGSIANCFLLHDSSYYAGDSYHVCADIYRNPHILGKTVLTVGDGLFGNWLDNLSIPSPWSTFGDDAPNSLFFATDPVAVDCVMCDLLHAERTVTPMANDLLIYAASVGLGTYERGDPWGSGYRQIDYFKIEL